MVEMMVEVVEVMVEEDIFHLFSFFSLLISLFPSLFSFFPSFFFFFVSKFQKNLHEIRIWRRFWFFEECM